MLSIYLSLDLTAQDILNFMLGLFKNIYLQNVQNAPVPTPDMRPRAVVAFGAEHVRRRDMRQPRETIIIIIIIYLAAVGRTTSSGSAAGRGKPSPRDSRTAVVARAKKSCVCRRAALTIATPPPPPLLITIICCLYAAADRLRVYTRRRPYMLMSGGGGGNDRAGDGTGVRFIKRRRRRGRSSLIGRVLSVKVTILYSARTRCAYYLYRV